MLAAPNGQLGSISESSEAADKKRESYVRIGSNPTGCNPTGLLSVATRCRLARALIGKIRTMISVRVLFNSVTCIVFSTIYGGIARAQPIAPQMTAAVTAANGTCPAVPTAKTSFASTDNKVWFVVTYTGGNAGDNFSVEWLEPNGRLYATNNFTQAKIGGSYCYDFFIGVAGFPPAGIAGTWSVQLLWNSTVISTAHFTISGPFIVLSPQVVQVTVSATCDKGSACTYASQVTPPVVSVSSTGAAFSYNFSSATYSNGGAVADWLVLSAPSDNVLAISVTPSEVQTGLGIITISASGEANSPQLLPVVANVSCHGNNCAGIHVIQEGSDVLPPSVTPSVITFSSSGPLNAPVAVTNPSDAYVTGTNVTLIYNSAASSSNIQGWLSISPSPGSSGPANGTIEIMANPAGLIPGQYVATILFTAEGCAARPCFTQTATVPVVLYVNSAQATNPALVSIANIAPFQPTASASAQTIMVTGSNFESGLTVVLTAPNGSTTTLSGSQIQYVSATALQMSAALSSAGQYIFQVTNPDGGMSTPFYFTVLAGIQASPPSVVAISPFSPTASPTAQAFAVTGSNFERGLMVALTAPDGSTTTLSGAQIQYVSATTFQMSAVLAASGSYSFLVMNPNGGASAPFYFNVLKAVQTISHIADGGGWKSTIILMNTDMMAAPYTVNLWGDTGGAFTPPLVLGSTTGTIPVGGSVTIRTADTNTNLTEGWAEVVSSQSIGGTAIFRSDAAGQEAAVPLQTSGGTKLEIPYEAGNGLALGVALANPSTTQGATVTEIIRDENGNQFAQRTLNVSPQNHIAFNPPGLNGISGSGVLEYDSNTSIYGLGVRTAGAAFTSIDAVYPQAPATKTIPHIADGGGWRSTIILLNMDTVPVAYKVNFWSDTGASFSPRLSVGATTGTIPVGGSVTIETADSDPNNLSEGWAEVLSSQSIGGTTIFRFDTAGQEAAVPLLTSGGTSLEIPYEVGNGLSLGVALANPSTTQSATVTETIRHENGSVMSTRQLNVAAHSHIAFNPPGLNGMTGLGVVEYDSNVSIYALGVRGANGTFTSEKAIYK